MTRWSIKREISAFYKQNITKIFYIRYSIK